MGIGRDVLLQIRLLLENSQYKPALDKAVTDTESAAKRMADAHGNASQDMQGEAGKLIAKLSEQNATFGMSEAQLRRYRAEQVAMSEAQRAATNALLDNLEAMEAQASAGGLTRLAASAGDLATAATAAAAVVVTAAAGVAAAYHFAGQETLAYEKAIILSGNAAGVTSGQLADMARRIDGVAGTQANAAAALATMTASGKVAAENLEKVSLAAIEMERATGQSVGDTERIFARLGDEPTKAALSLNESMHFLTASTYAQIKAAEDLGDKEGAAAIAQGAAADAMRTRAAEIEQHLGSLERVMRGVRSVAAEMWDAVLAIGRPVTLDSQIAALNNKIKQTAWRGPAATEGLQQEIAYLQEQQRMVKRSTEAQAENNRVQQARIELSQALEQTASKQEKLALAVARANALADRSGATDAERLQLVTAAQEKFAEKSTSAAKATASEYDKLMQRLGVDVPKAAAQAQAAQQGYNKAQAEFVALAGSPAWAKFTNEQRASAAAMFEQKIASEQAAEAARSAAEEKVKAQELLAKADLEAAQAREKYIASLDKGLDKIQADIAAQEEATARMGLSKEAIADLDAAKLEMMATDLELQAIKAMDRNLDEQTYDALKQQAQAYRDLAKAKQAGAAKEVAVDAAKNAADEWQRTSDQVNQSLTDALMRGFESGKDFAKNLRDTVVNMFKTLVLRPVISAIISPISGALLGGLGLSTAAQAAQGGGLSTALSGASLLSSFGGLNAGLSYGAQSLFANGLGTTLTAGTQMLGAGSYMGGLGTIMGALGPIAVGIALLSSLIKKSTPHMGAGVTYSAADGLVRGADQYNKGNYGFGAASEYSSAAESMVANIARGLVTALDGAATMFGKKAGFEISTAFADDKSKDGAWGSLVIKQDGKTLLDWRDTQTGKWAPREFADGEEGARQYAAAVAKDVMSVIDGMGLPEWAQKIADSLPEGASLDDLNAMLAKLSSYPNELLQAYGTSRDALVQQFVDGLKTTDAATAGQSVADSLVQSIQDSMFANGAAQIFDIVNQGIVTPMLDALITGQAVSGAVSDAAIQATVDKAVAAAEALGQIFEDPAFQAAMESLRTSMASALATAGQVLQTSQSSMGRVSSIVERITSSITSSASVEAAAAVDSALANLRRAISAERDLISTQLDASSSLRDEIKNVFDLLEQSVRSLRDEAVGVEQTAAQGQAYISAALSGARATGSMPDADELSHAIAAARAGLSVDQYSSIAEQRFAQLKLAAELDALKEISGEQLTEAEYQIKLAEDQLKALDDTLNYWEQQVEAARGGVTATLSVESAVTAMQLALQKSLEDGFGSISGLGSGDLEKQLAEVASQYSPGTSADAVKQLSKSVNAGDIGLNDAVHYLAGTPVKSRLFTEQVEVYKNFDAAGYYADLRKNMDELIGQGYTAQAMADLMISMGVSLTDAANAYGTTAAEVAANLLRNGATRLPQLAVGTNYLPEDMVIQAHQGERVIPAADNAELMRRLSAPDHSEALARALIAEVRALRAQNAGLERRLESIESHTRRTTETLDSVTEGGNAMRQIAA